MQTRRRTNLLWGVLALGVALVVLLHTLDMIPPGVADLLLRSWPALLVLVGLAIFLRPRVSFGGLLALLISLGLVAGVGVVAFSTRATEQRDDYRESVQQPIASSVTLLRLRVNTGNTDVEIIPALGSARVVTGQFTGSVESTLRNVYLEDEAAATLSLFEEQASQFPLLENVGRGTLRLELPPGIPLDVELIGGTGSISLNTSALDIERMNVDLRQGNALVTLPVYQPRASQPGDNLGTLAVREGDITLFIPPEVAARLELNRGGSGIEPLYDPAVYNFLVGDVLEARAIVTAPITMRYEVVAPRGRIRVEVPAS
jgi:hypothetical protein